MKAAFKKLSFFLLTALVPQILPALPGIVQTIPDASGQFVYYQDRSFARESYFGVLYYDDSTYAVRYFAPEQKEKNEAEKDFTIYFSVDPDKKYFDMTGEKIVGRNYEREPDIINYLHDMIYELTARRKKLGIITQGVAVETDYPQFGGNVKISYDPLVPIFNLQSITSVKGEKLLTLITQGQLTSAEDESFTNFTGIPANTDKETHNFTPNKKARKSEAAYECSDKLVQSIKITDQWKKQSDNFWTLEQDAVLSMNYIQLPPETASFDGILRTLMLGTNCSYPASEKIIIKEKKLKNRESTSLIQVFYNDLTKSYTTDLKRIVKITDEEFAIVTLTVFSNAYDSNTKYFNNIFDSYKISEK